MEEKDIEKEEVPQENDGKTAVNAQEEEVKEETTVPEADAAEKVGESVSAGSSKKEGGRKLFKKKEEKKKAEESDAGSRRIEELEAALAASDAKLAETNDKYIRLAAEFDNFRRRTAKERLELISSAGEDVLKGLLPTLDDCEKALDMLSRLEGCDAAVEGTKLIYDKLMAYLRSRGITRMEAVGADFDTDLHEAVAQFPVQEEEKKNKIIDVVRQGYKLKDKVIRYAQVVVGI